MKTEQHKHTSEEKTAWFGHGEWVEEPDYVEFTYKGYKCQVIRICIREPYAKEFHAFGGHLCGYVQLPESHPYIGKEGFDLDIDCHGGITYSDHGFIGFDCVHSGDYLPSTEHLKKTNFEMIASRIAFPVPKGFEKFALFNPVYRNMDYCIKECKSIVRQLIKMETSKKEIK